MKSEFAKTGNVQPTKQASTAIHREIITAVSAFNVRNCSCITYSVYLSIRQYKLLRDTLAKLRLIRQMPILACPACPACLACPGPLPCHCRKRFTAKPPRGAKGTPQGLGRAGTRPKTVPSTVAFGAQIRY